MFAVLLAERQSGFAAALLDATRDVPIDLVGPDRAPSVKRFSVYRNNVVVSLIDALEAAYPATCRLVGEEFFRAMARAFAVCHPPASPIMLHYGEGFPDFVAQSEPARSLPYLADVARIERAWLEAYHAPEATPLSMEALARIDDRLVAGMRFELHPSVRIVRSRYPALTIWRMNVDDGVPAFVDLEAGGEDILVLRPNAEVEVRYLPPGGAEFVGALSDGQSLASAAECAMTIPAFDLASTLAALMNAGLFVGFSCAEPEI
jgi:hypothetical protein